MRKVFFILLMLCASLVGLSQNFIQGSVQQGATPNSVNINFLPNYTSAAGEYVNYIGLAIAVPTASATGVTPSLTMTGPFASISMTQAIPFSYTAGTETIWAWVFSSGGTTMNWTQNTAFTGATITFTGGAGAALVKLVDFASSGGGANSNSLFVLVTNKTPFDVVNYSSIFYSLAGSSTTGTYGNGDQFSQTVPLISMGICNGSPNAGTVSGTSPLCIGETATYTSNGDAGGTWSSTNSAVATVNTTTGAVTAVGAGTTNITYTVNGCSPVSSFKALTVNGTVNAGTVSGSSPLCIGNTANYSSNGNEGGTWSTNNPSVATVNSTTGQVTAVSAGNATITYTVNTGCGSPVSASQSVTVNPGVNAGTVTGTSPLTIGGTDTYTSNGTAGGAWSSSNAAVATVNATTGLVTAVAAGTTDITYTVNSGCGSPVSSFKSLTVNAPTNAGTVSGTSPLCIGANSTYTSNGDAGGTWSSTNTSVATVNASTGLVTAIGAGTTNITYTVNGVNALKTLTVNPSVSAGTVTGTSPLNVGGTATYTSNGTAGGSWSSSNTAVASVNASTGLVTAIAAGTTNITYTVNSGCGSPVSAFAALTVNAIEIHYIQGSVQQGASPNTVSINFLPNFTSAADEYVNYLSFSIAVPTASATGVIPSLNMNGPFTGMSMTPAIPFTYTDGTETVWSWVYSSGPSSMSWTKDVAFTGATISFTGGNGVSKVRLVDFTNHTPTGGANSNTLFLVVTNKAPFDVTNAANLFYAIAGGNGSILGTYPNTDQYVETMANITMGICNANSNAGIVSGTSPLTIGGTATFTTDGDAGGTWSSTNTAVATVDAATGLVTAVGVGTSNITYTVSGCSPVSSSKTLTVNSLTNAGTVSGTSPLCIGVTATYTSNGDGGGTWSSTNMAVATVDANTGAVTAVGAGTTDITYTVNSVSAFKTLTVNPGVSAGTVSGTSPLAVGGTTAYTSNGTGGGSWSSSNAAVATVNASTGLVTAVGAGTTNITYTVNSGCGSPVSAFAALTVNGADAHYITGSVQQGALLNTVNISFLPNYTSAADEYVNYLSISIAVPTTSATGVTPSLIMTGPFTGMTLVPAIPFSYTAGSETIWSWVFSSGPSTMSWTKDVAFTGATVSFAGGSGVSKVRMVDFTNYSPAGGNNSNTYFLVVTNKSPYDVTNYSKMFHAIAGANGSVTGTYPNTDQYVETIANISMGSCNANANAGIVSGSSPLCIGGSTTFISNGDVGGTWSSTNTAVATVNAITGMVTAVGAGTTNITYTVTGCSPVSSYKTLTVNTVPVLTTTSLSTGCGGGTVNLNSGITSSTTGLTVTFYSDAAMTIVISNMVSGSGTYFVKVNNAACSATGSIRVTSADMQNPLITCPSNISITTNSCNKSVVTNNPVYSDNCTVSSVTWTMSGATTGSSPAADLNFVGTKTFNVGVTTITYTVKDAAGNIASCSYTVTVKESKAPSISCPSSIFQFAGNGQCSKTVTVPNPTISDNCGVASLTWVMTGATTGSSSTTNINYLGTQAFNPGITKVTYTAKDGSGNTATCSFTVTIRDTEGPVIHCPADISSTVLTGCSRTITVPDPQYSDNCGNVSRLIWVMVGATNDLSPLSGINTVGTRSFKAGVTLVTYVAVDASGNIRTCRFKVTVADNINPTITCPSPITQNSETGKCFSKVSTPNPVFGDNCKVDRLTWRMTGATSSSSSPWGINYVGTKTFNVGVTTVTYTAKDDWGNSASCSYTVTINGAAHCQNSNEGNGRPFLEATAFPNPSDHHFNLRIGTDDRENVQIRVTDVTGRLVQQLYGSPDKIYIIGESLKEGIYFVNVIQGNKHTVIKIVKQ